MGDFLLLSCHRNTTNEKKQFSPLTLKSNMSTSNFQEVEFYAHDFFVKIWMKHVIENFLIFRVNFALLTEKKVYIMK